MGNCCTLNDEKGTSMVTFDPEVEIENNMANRLNSSTNSKETTSVS